MVLAAMIVPIITAAARDVLAVPRELIDSRSSVERAGRSTVVLPFGQLLVGRWGLGRALGEPWRCT